MRPAAATGSTSAWPGGRSMQRNSCSCDKLCLSPPVLPDEVRTHERKQREERDEPREANDEHRDGRAARGIVGKAVEEEADHGVVARGELTLGGPPDRAREQARIEAHSMKI